MEQVEVLSCPTRSMGVGECRHPCGALVFICNVMILFLSEQGFGQEMFSSRPQYGSIETGLSRSNRLVRAPSSGGGSNAPRPALSVPHLDVDVDGG